jgi:hypothetical protein
LAPGAAFISIPDPKALFFDDMEWKGLAIGTFAGWVLGLLVAGRQPQMIPIEVSTLIITKRTVPCPAMASVSGVK